jgi:hypothetical protein
MKTKLINTAVILLAIAFLASMLVSALWRFIPHEAINAALNVNFPIWLAHLYVPLTVFVHPITHLIIRITVAIWLFKASRKTWQYPSFWCLMGLVLGPLALAIYYLIEIHGRLKRIEEKTEASRP